MSRTSPPLFRHHFVRNVSVIRPLTSSMMMAMQQREGGSFCRLTSKYAGREAAQPTDIYMFTQQQPVCRSVQVESDRMSEGNNPIGGERRERRELTRRGLYSMTSGRALPPVGDSTFCDYTRNCGPTNEVML